MAMMLLMTLASMTCPVSLCLSSSVMPRPAVVPATYPMPVSRSVDVICPSPSL